MSKRTYPSIAARMSATGETQVEISRILGRSQPYVSKLVRNQIQPRLDEALKISSLLRIPVESLVSEVNRSEFLVGQQ